MSSGIELSVTIKSIMLNVVKLSVIVLKVAAPIKEVLLG